MAAEALCREMTFRAMGSDCHLIVVGGPPGILETLHTRILDLEQRWSRFLPGSEVSLLNTSQGLPVLVSDETKALVTKALDANHRTSGLFDATVLGDLIRAGYDRPFEFIANTNSGVSNLFRGPITLIGPTVMLAPGTGFDPGGIGKGLAADIVADEALRAGAGGVSVNLGGDVRVVGRPPRPGGWSISIEHPGTDTAFVTVGLDAGAVATSTLLLRRWSSNGTPRHHIIDPATGRPADTDLTLVSVLAAEAWEAEVFAKACLLAGSEHWMDPISGTGMDALAVTRDGEILSTPGLTRFTDRIPTQIPQLETGAST